MNLKRLLNTQIGVIFISIMLGFGVACLFRKVCVDEHCIEFKGAVIDMIHDKIYEHDNKCFQYKAKSVKCNPVKTIVDVSDPISID